MIFHVYTNTGNDPAVEADAFIRPDDVDSGLSWGEIAAHTLHVWRNDHAGHVERVSIELYSDGELKARVEQVND